MAQSWLIVGGSEEEKLAEVKRVWSSYFGKEPFPRYDVLRLKEETIKISQVREIGRFLHIRPVVASVKVVVVCEAERLTAAAANAFLKTLEEPPGGSLVFLLTDKPYELPVTILSRCQTVKVGGGEKRETEGEREWVRQLVGRSVEGRLAVLSDFRGEREIFLKKVQAQIEWWREMWLEAVADKREEERWARQGLSVFSACEKMLMANVNLKLVEGWLALFLPKKGKMA